MKLLIADGSTAHRSKIVRYMNYIPGLEVVAEVRRASGLARSYQKARVDVVVLDLASAGEEGSFRFLRRLKKEERAPFVIMLVREGEREARRALYRSLGADFVFDREQEIDKTLDVLEILDSLLSQTNFLGRRSAGATRSAKSLHIFRASRSLVLFVT